jgi:hypothetical protein
MHHRSSTSGRLLHRGLNHHNIYSLSPPLNGAPPHPLLFPELKRSASMPPTNWLLDHHLPFPPRPYKRSRTSAETHHTPSPFDSLRLKTPLDEAHRTPAPISTARPTPVTPRQVIASNEFPNSPSHFRSTRGDPPTTGAQFWSVSGDPAAV